MRKILKFILIPLGIIAFICLRLYTLLSMNRIERYVAYITWANKVTIEMSDIVGHPSKARYNEMWITIKGSKDFLYYAFNPYVEKDRFDHEMKALSQKIMKKLEARNKVNFDILRITISTNSSPFSPTGPRTKTHFHFVD